MFIKIIRFAGQINMVNIYETVQYFFFFFFFWGGGERGRGGELRVSDFFPNNQNLNKSTASGAIYARSSVIFDHHMAFVWGMLMQ